IGRGDAHELVAGDVQIELAADAAVGADRAHHFLRMPHLLRREPLARHDLEDRARRADANALAAPGTAGFVRITVGADDDLGVLAAESDVQHAHHLDVFARPHAAGAQNAGRHVVADHRIAGALVARAQRQIAIDLRRRHDVVVDEIALELVARIGAAAVAQVLGGIALGEEAQDALAVLHRGMGLRGDDHTVRHLRGAGGDQLWLPLHRHETNAAIADDGELRVPAKGRYLDARVPGSIEDRLTLFRSERTTVDLYRRQT